MNLGSMLFGAAGSAVLAVLFIPFAARERRPGVIATAAVSAAFGPVWWNLILRWTGATGMFSHDIPFRPFPVSWQDTKSGVFTLGLATVALSFGACAEESDLPVGPVGPLDGPCRVPGRHLPLLGGMRVGSGHPDRIRHQICHRETVLTRIV